MSKRELSKITIKMLVKWGKAESFMSESYLRTRIGAVWMDSRKIKQGDIFIALKSDTNDGHNYVSAAFKSGAVAAVVSKKKADHFSVREKKKLIIVPDPLKAVQKMAAEYRKSFNIPFVAITGSNGKTTTSRFVSTVLSTGFTVGTTKGNWNNHIGVPLSILRLNGKEKIAVVEFGANHKNEINTLTRIVKPDIGIVTNIGYAHIGYFGTLNKTTDAKFEIVNGMNKNKGLLLLNGDDTRLVKKSREIGYNVVFFGTSTRCGIRAENIKTLPGPKVQFSVNGYKYLISMSGHHFVYCALPAIFLARQMGLNENDIKKAVSSVKPDPMRGRIQKKSGVTFVVDCYNSNPSSIKPALALLKDVASGSTMNAIIGDMLELGKYSRWLHRQLGNQLASSNISKIIAVGEYAKYVAEGAIRRGMEASSIYCVPNSDDAVSYAQKILKKGNTVLLKGSRAIRLEKVFNEF